MEAFLQILQRTMKILAMPGRLSAMLKANIRIWAMISVSKQQKQVIRVQKLVGLPPLALELLGVFLRFRRTFAEVITFGGASAHEF